MLQNINIILHNIYIVMCLWIRDLKIYTLYGNKFFHVNNCELLFLQGVVIERLRTDLRLNYNLSYFSNNFTVILYLQRSFFFFKLGPHLLISTSLFLRKAVCHVPFK